MKLLKDMKLFFCVGFEIRQPTMHVTRNNREEGDVMSSAYRGCVVFFKMVPAEDL